MAISKERVIQLIKQDATIYSIGESFMCAIPTAFIEHIFDNKIGVEFGWNSITVLEKGGGLYKEFDLGELTEDKDEYEFAIKYTNISRTEYLSFLRWDLFQHYGKFSFWSAINKEYLIRLTEDNKGEFICIFQFKDGTAYLLFHEKATKENYYKALDVCVKLWKGEEV